jgi:hypothetical protein
VLRAVAALSSSDDINGRVGANFVNEQRIATASVGDTDRAGALRALMGRAMDLGWFRDVETRVVVQVDDSVSRSLPAGALDALTAAICERVPSAHVELSDGSPGPTLVLQGFGGSLLKVPKTSFERRFVVTVAVASPDLRWRIAGALLSQARPILTANPNLPPAQALAEAHRLIGADLALVCCKQGSSGEWWAASPSAVQIDGLLARAARIDPNALPAIRAIARHELLEAWDVAAVLPDGSIDAGRVATSALAVAGDWAAFALWHLGDDARRTARNLPKIPKVLRRQVARFLGRGQAA